MEAFTRVSGIAAPLLEANIDTDLLIPSREINDPGKAGYGVKLLAPRRYRPGPVGSRVEDPDFVLNRPPFREAVILVAGENFGCGSSREAAAWAVRQFGLRSVIAPSFGAIFRNNCLRNGILPVVLPADTVKALARDIEGGQPVLTVDLHTCTVTRADGSTIPFEMAAAERTMLLEGLDAIGLTLKERAHIESFEARDRAARPWIWQVATRGDARA